MKKWLKDFADNLAPHFFSPPVLALFFILLGGCANNYVLDPVQRGLVTLDPENSWDPEYSYWYCPKKPAVEDPAITALLGSLTESNIETLLDIALRNHPLTRLAWAQARAQAFAVGAAESAYYPTISAVETLEFVHLNVDDGIINPISVPSGNAAGATGAIATSGTSSILNAVVPGSSGSSNTAASVRRPNSEVVISQVFGSYLLLDFGGRDANVRANKYALFNLNWTKNRVVQQVIIGVVQGYYNYIQSKELLKAKIEDLKNADLNLEAAEVQYRVGVVRKLDYLQALSNQENAVLALIQAQGQVKINLGALALALGISPSTEFETKDLPEFFPLDEVEMNIDALIEIAKRQRPDLAAAYATILQNKMEVVAAISSSLPTLTSSINFQRLNYPDQSGTNQRVFVGAISLNIPLFSGFLYENQIRQAQENVYAAKANYDNLESQALYDVVSAYYTFISAKESVKYSEQYLKTALEAYDLAYVTYRMGTGSILELLTAQAALSDARAQRITARTTWASSLFNIAYAIGTLSPSLVSDDLR